MDRRERRCFVVTIHHPPVGRGRQGGLAMGDADTGCSGFPSAGAGGLNGAVGAPATAPGGETGGSGGTRSLRRATLGWPAGWRASWFYAMEHPADQPRRLAG